MIRQPVGLMVMLLINNNTTLPMAMVLGIAHFMGYIFDACLIRTLIIVTKLWLGGYVVRSNAHIDQTKRPFRITEIFIEVEF